jgi:hypothetical protein
MSFFLLLSKHHEIMEKEVNFLQSTINPRKRKGNLYKFKANILAELTLFNLNKLMAREHPSSRPWCLLEATAIVSPIRPPAVSANLRLLKDCMAN